MSSVEPFGTFDLETMSEADVEQIIVRPLLHELGYRQGTEANIRTQVTFRYGQYFFGRKKPRTDPELRARPDFICEVVSVGRWVVEAKSPAKPLSADDSEQAHTYATHPEIAAEFYLLTNGRSFQLYRTFKPEEPLLTWAVEATADMLPTLKMILGPEAVRKRSLVKIDLGKPLAPGYGSVIEIIRGIVTYDKHTSDFPIDTGSVDGVRAGIVGQARRTTEGLIEAELDMISPYAAHDAINAAVGFKDFTFRTADEYVSLDRDNPTIFQNIVRGSIPQGTSIPARPGFPGLVVPMKIAVVCYTEAVGFIEESTFQGTFAVDYDMTIQGLPKPILIRGEGRFELVVAT